ncbi:general L-amino acid transport system substrate-binding protein [Variovorax sp. HW608]|uniref:amino acid ABC transporter substrate-binding protein n=1 Tax=Variovorax sp. HW608 TaxID=1034889 RepID=UPI00081FF7B9|nr:amino acid ABC transporter substrate-binding protein [Variovorax sp. HW608]SCK20065.1 general L-amino acid transport system substrate-binding protein [Variovorax sp. HW608]
MRISKSHFQVAAGVAAVVLAGMALTSAPAMAQQGKSALDAIKERGNLRCSAHNGSFAGFFEVDDKGNWKGFDIQFCKALATAILGSPEKVTYVPLSWAQRFPSLISGDVDVVFKATGWTLSRDTKQKIDFSLPYFMGGFQFMVPPSSGIKSGKELNGATVCTAAGTSIEPVLADFMATEKVKFKVVTYEKSEEERSAYESGRCDAMAGWGPSLAVARAQQKGLATHTILPITLTLEPIGAALRQDDKRFRDVVGWTIAAMIHAEEIGISSANVDTVRSQVAANPTANPGLAKFLGVQKGLGAELGLSDTWAYDVIKKVGNYGEIYDRELGAGSPYRLDRGLNRLWKNGGLIYSPVFD